MIEVARQLASREKKLPRRIMFISLQRRRKRAAGSARYVREPLIPLDKTIAMLNMDMVGRLHDNKLIVYGNGTAPEWDVLLKKFNEKLAFDITRHPEGARTQRPLFVLHQANSSAALLHWHAQRLPPP